MMIFDKLERPFPIGWILGVFLLCAPLACGGGGSDDGDPVNPNGDTASVGDTQTPQPDTNTTQPDTNRPGCTPNCLGKQCGDNGCGGTCPSLCTDTQMCQNGACVTKCTPACTGKQCGDDGCGSTCGSCNEGATCSQAGQCVESGPTTGNCPPNGTGTTVGKQIKNIVWDESTGQPLELHSFCGAKAIVLIETAGW